MDTKKVSEYIGDVSRLLDDFFFKPIISTAMSRFDVNNAKEIRYFLQDAQTYIDDKPFMEDGIAELISFTKQVKSKVLPKIDEALLISPFQYNKFSMAEDEYLYRKMMSHVFRDNVGLLADLSDKLHNIFPDGTLRHTTQPDRNAAFKHRLLIRA